MQFSVPTSSSKVTLFFVFFLFALSFLLEGCAVKSVCYNNADCPNDQVCEIVQGQGYGQCKAMCQDDSDCSSGYFCDPSLSTCKEVDCQIDSECTFGFECKDGQCISRQPLNCQEGMVSIEDKFCIDIYESSRPDATDQTSGVDSSFATSRKGVLPWQVKDNAEAQTACEAAGKSLCKESQWFQACSGPQETTYSYGDEYDPGICNGIDTYCDCSKDGPCANRSSCPFEYCHDVCGGSFSLDVTGLNPDCSNAFLVFDMNGNLWEHVLDGDETRIRGGAYNCGDSKTLHRCDYIPGNWRPSARGFRCCNHGLTEEDAGPLDDSNRGREK